MNWQTHKQQLLKNPEVQQALQESSLEYELAKAIIDSRVHKGLTQQDLAKKMNTRQSVISRVENAKTVPSLSFLKRLADVLGASLEVQFKI